MITKRDRLVINYLNEYKCAHTSTLKRFYPDIRTCQRRLKILCDNKEIRRVRDNINQEYIYYILKPKQLRHSVLLTDFFREFARVAELQKCIVKFEINGVKPDALIGFKQDNRLHIAFVEVQISHTPLDVLKYEKLYYSGVWKGKLPEFPIIIAVTNHKIPETKLTVLKVNEDLSNLVIGGYYEYCD
jgi:hypothetical protein